MHWMMWLLILHVAFIAEGMGFIKQWEWWFTAVIALALTLWAEYRREGKP